MVHTDITSSGIRQVGPCCCAHFLLPPTATLSHRLSFRETYHHINQQWNPSPLSTPLKWGHLSFPLYTKEQFFRFTDVDTIFCPIRVWFPVYGPHTLLTEQYYNTHIEVGHQFSLLILQLPAGLLQTCQLHRATHMRTSTQCFLLCTLDSYYFYFHNSYPILSILTPSYVSLPNSPSCLPSHFLPPSLAAFLLPCEVTSLRHCSLLYPCSYSNTLALALSSKMLTKTLLLFLLLVPPPPPAAI